jgi:hypothetical protein
MLSGMAAFYQHMGVAATPIAAGRRIVSANFKKLKEKPHKHYEQAWNVAGRWDHRIVFTPTPRRCGQMFN